jgi:predicted enzyme related to lactoylglutathione lyase
MRTLLPLVALMSLLSSCTGPTLPAITEEPTDTFRSGEFVWKDLISVNAAASAKFYSDVFGWEVTKVMDADPAYYTIKNRGELIGGILDYPDKGKVDANEWLSTMSARNVADAASKVTSSGGQVFANPHTVPGRGDYLIAVDPSGGIVALLDSETGDPRSAEPNFNDWLWTELWSNDPESVVDFYQELGYSIEEDMDDDRQYWILKAGKKNVGGMMQNPAEDTRSMWLPYIRTEDVESMSARVIRMGGRVLSEPQGDVRSGTVALCADPYGGIFAIQEWSK